MLVMGYANKMYIFPKSMPNEVKLLSGMIRYMDTRQLGKTSIHFQHTNATRYAVSLNQIDKGKKNLNNCWKQQNIFERELEYSEEYAM